MKGEQPFGIVTSPAAVTFFIWLVVRGSCPVEQDVKYAAHAAHAVDPSVLDAGNAGWIIRTVPSVGTTAIPRLPARDDISQSQTLD